MSLRRAKTLYCVTMIAVSVLLAAWGGALGCAAGALLLVGALPLFKVINREGVLNALRGLHHEDAHHTQSADQSFEDQTPAPR